MQGSSKLRQRNKAGIDKEGVELGKEAEEAEKRDTIYGRTPDGRVFPIPETHDVLTGLFDPRLPKSSLDILTLTLLASQIALWLYLPRKISRYVFMILFAICRLAYNAGLGYILTKQSKKRWIVNTFKRQGWLDENKSPKIKSWIVRQVSIKMGTGYDFDSYPIEYNVWVLFRHGVDIILLNDFLSYFLCGISFMHKPQLEDSKAVFLYLTRWASGVTLLVFNLWVKMDAHRIVTDLAWYWADAFFISLQNLIFDGVFEMAPHPMYSVGYAGYYGLSIIVGSETVLFVSLSAHACQFAFLVFFENPHIDRTYGERKPLAMRKPLRTTESQSQPLSATVAATSNVIPENGIPVANNIRVPRSWSHSASSSVSQDSSTTDTRNGSEASDEETDTETEIDTDVATHRFSHRHRGASASSTSSSMDLGAGDEILKETNIIAPLNVGIRPQLQSRHDLDNYYFRHDTIIFQNFDPLRASDLAFALAVFYLVTACILQYINPTKQLVAMFVNALAWRFIHTFVLGGILKAQSEKKWMVRHFLKHYHYEDLGYTAVDEAFNNWKSIYNMSLCMVYASFGLLAIKCYDWSLTTEATRHTLGLLLIALHIWTAKEIYDVLGRFGWFYGDFFIQHECAPLELYYTGIYRHVNNPERIMGGAAFFGLALVSGSKLVGVLAMISVLSHFWFLSCVENPHMKRLYGNALRKDAGVTKTWKGVANKQSHRAPQQVKRAVQEFHGTLERVYDDTSMAVEDFLKKSGPKLTGYVENTKVLLKEQGERLLITRIADVGAIDVSAYSVKLERPAKVQVEESLPDLPQAKRMPCYQIGEPIRLHWTAPDNCSRRDWIGLYRFGANRSKLVTRSRSRGRWLGIYPDEWDGDHYVASSGASGSLGEDVTEKVGSLLYTDTRLFWKPGYYEFRYHHDGKHNVMALSEPFEIKVDRPAGLEDYPTVYDMLLPLVSRCLNSDPALVPQSAYPLLKEAPDDKAKTNAHGERTHPDDFVIFTNEQAERIATAIKDSCDLELTSEVIVAEANVAKLARSIVDSTKMLQPFSGLRKT